jgi:hypothetical protein
MPASIDLVAFMRDGIERSGAAALDEFHPKVSTTDTPRAISNCSGCLVNGFGFSSWKRMLVLIAAASVIRCKFGMSIDKRETFHSGRVPQLSTLRGARTDLLERWLF